MKQRSKIALGILSLLCIWSILIYQLSLAWETNEQYAHGFLVPLLCLFLLLKTQPIELDAQHFLHKRKNLICYTLGLILLISLFPIWLVRGANSDWRLLNLVLFAVVFLLSAILLLFHQERTYHPKSFLFPLLFFLVAIPWPLATDLKLTQALQEKISTIIVDLLLLLEHEARLSGTVIDIGVFGKVGIDQACSGINGLQASIVVSLFIGAYYAFPLRHRFLLLIAGMLFALFFNLCRAFCLSFVKVRGKGDLIDEPLFSVGDFSIPSIHDLAGFVETGLIFLSILFLARLSKGGLFLTTLGTHPSNWKNVKVSPPIGFSLLTLGFTLSAIAATELHFKNFESKMLEQPSINIDLNDSSILLIENEISRQIRVQLHFTEAKSSQWQDLYRSKLNSFGGLEINQNEEYWQAFEARWESGGACTAVLSTHSPESCLPLTGLAQINPPQGAEPILVPIKIQGRSVLFEAYEFSRDARKLFVFRCFWPHKMAPDQPNLFPRGGYSSEGRIKSALEGRRNVGGTMLALALANVDSSETAISKLQALAGRRLIFFD